MEEGKRSEIVNNDVNNNLNRTKNCKVCSSILDDQQYSQCSLCHGFFHPGKCAGVGDVNCRSCEKLTTKGKSLFPFVLSI